MKYRELFFEKKSLFSICLEAEVEVSLKVELELKVLEVWTAMSVAKSSEPMSEATS